MIGLMTVREHERRMAALNEVCERRVDEVRVSRDQWKELAQEALGDLRSVRGFAPSVGDDVPAKASTQDADAAAVRARREAEAEARRGAGR